MTSNLDWQAIRSEYESGQSSLSSLEREHGVSRQAIKKRAIKEKWVTPQLQVTVTPDKQGGTNRDVNATLRVASALKLRAQKLTYQEIAQRCGYANAKSAHRAIQRELQRIVVENVEELRREESHMYDIGHSECWLLFMDRKNTWRLTAWDRILATSIERRKLLNLDVKPDDTLAGVTIIREYGVEVDRV